MHFKDPAFLVANAAKDIIAVLTKEIPEIYIIVKGLSTNYFEQYMELINERKVDIPNSIEIKTLTHSLATSHQSSQATMKVASFVDAVSKSNYPTNSDGLIFGVLTSEQMGFINDSDWKLRTKGIEELEGTVSKNPEALLPFVSSFVRFLIKLLNDPNFKIVYSSMQILAHILKFQQLPQKMDISILLNGLVERLGDNKIAIRQASYNLLRNLYKLMKGKEFLTQLNEFLCSANWHIRECLLNLITVVFLEERLSGFNKSHLVMEIAKLLDDSKPKVSLAAFETLAVIAIKCGIEVLNDIATEFIDKEVYNKLCDKVEASALPSINEDGMIDYNNNAQVPVIEAVII